MKEMRETLRLYDKDAYETEFTAEVLSCEEKADKTYEVVLDQTLFFPEEGGQSPDIGTIHDIEVLDVQIKKDVIYHSLAKPLTPGETVTGKIDWQHRFFNMQQHSGEHLFSGIVHTMFGFHNVGFHLSNQIVTMDFDGVLSEKDVEEVEWKVNEAIVKNIPVEVTFPSKEELEVMEYRSKIEIEGQVRIVTIPGYDVCACCAPHVKRTGEIGLLKVMNVQSYKGGVRISILCGFRALGAFREKAAVVSSLMNTLSTNQDALVENVEKLKENNQNLKAQLTSAKQTLLSYKTAEIPAEQEDVLLFEKDLEAPVMRNVINELVEVHSGICGIFSGDDKSGYHYIIGSKNIDCKTLATKLKEELNSRGGGSNVMIQGSVVAGREDIEHVLLNH